MGLSVRFTLNGEGVDMAQEILVGSVSTVLDLYEDLPDYDTRAVASKLDSMGVARGVGDGRLRAGLHMVVDRISSAGWESMSDVTDQDPKLSTLRKSCSGCHMES